MAAAAARAKGAAAGVAAADAAAKRRGGEDGRQSSDADAPRDGNSRARTQPSTQQQEQEQPEQKQQADAARADNGGGAGGSDSDETDEMEELARAAREARALRRSGSAAGPSNGGGGGGGGGGAAAEPELPHGLTASKLARGVAFLGETLGLPAADAEEGLVAEAEHWRDWDRWLFEAQMWLARRNEDKDEAAKEDAARAVSLLDHERELEAAAERARPIGELPEAKLRARFEGSAVLAAVSLIDDVALRAGRGSVLRDVGQRLPTAPLADCVALPLFTHTQLDAVAAPGVLLGDGAPAKAPLAALLQLERACVFRWYPGSGAGAFFRRFAGAAERGWREGERERV